MQRVPAVAKRAPAGCPAASAAKPTKSAPPAGVPSGIKAKPSIYALIGMARTWADKSGVMTEQQYYDMLLDRFGASSAKQLTAKQRDDVLAHFRRLGWGNANAQSDAWKDAPLWKKARSIWHAMAAAGAVKSDTDDALMAYVKRQTSIEHWRWLNARQCWIVIESLKLWAGRVNVTLLD